MSALERHTSSQGSWAYWGGTRTGFNPCLGPDRMCCVGGSLWVSCSPRTVELFLSGKDMGLLAGELLCSPPESQLSHCRTCLWCGRSLGDKGYVVRLWGQVG